jgi:hypothetical protein
MSVSDIIKDAKEYKQSRKIKAIIDRIICETLRDIKKNIEITHRKHNTDLKYKLQSVYNVEDVSNKTVQREVWSALILQLQAKHYKVRLRYIPNENICELLISWLEDVDYKKIKRQEQVIQSILLN